MPTHTELGGLRYCSKGKDADDNCVAGSKSPTINTTYFPMEFPDVYWTSSDYDSEPNAALIVDFENGIRYWDVKNEAYAVRLVRNGQSFNPTILATPTTTPTVTPTPNALAFGGYVKVSNNGKELPASAVLGSGPNDWACTYDSTTQLMWEVKTTDGGLRDRNWSYSWYDSNSPDGNKGTASGGNCKTAGRCDTEKFTQDVNTQGLCGSKDWRMPNRDELNALVYCSTGRSSINWCNDGSQKPTIDSSYFPNTPASWFWSSSLSAGNSYRAWEIFFYGGYDGVNPKESDAQVRLVRVRSENSYQLVVYPIDASQQGIVKGYVTDACTGNGLSRVEVNAFLGENLVNSTLTHNTGEFGLTLNPGNYTVKAIAADYISQQNKVDIISDRISSLTFNLEPVTGCPGQPWTTSVTLSGKPTSAGFIIQATANAGQSYANTFNNTQKIDLTGKIQVAPEHIGKSGVIYMVARYNNNWYMKTPQGWVAWNYNVANLKAAGAAHALSSIESFDIEKQLSGLAGNFAIYAGYGIDGDIYYSAQSFSLTVTASQQPTPTCAAPQVLQNGACVAVPGSLIDAILKPNTGTQVITTNAKDTSVKISTDGMTAPAKVEIFQYLNAEGNPQTTYSFDKNVTGTIEITLPDPNLPVSSAFNTPAAKTTLQAKTTSYPIKYQWNSGSGVANFLRITSDLQSTAQTSNRVDKDKLILEKNGDFNLWVLSAREWAYTLKSECKADDMTCSAGKIPVLFVHGFNRSGYGGGEDTWGYFPQAIKNQIPNARVFEFQWQTASRFEDSAVGLARAINTIALATGKKVHIIAHSFGGVLTRTYLQGLTSNPTAYYNNDVASVTTVGSPHSGIFDTAKTAHGVSFPEGQDSQHNGIPGTVSGNEQINACYQISCYEMGEFVNFSPVQLNIFSINATEVPKMEDKPGKFIANLSDMVSHPLPTDLPVQVLIGLTTSMIDNRYVDEGDGLISFSGQRIHPMLRKDKPYLTATNQFGGVVTEKLLGLYSDKPLYPDDIYDGSLLNQGKYGYRHSGYPISPTDAVPEVQVSETCNDYDCATPEHHAAFINARNWINTVGNINYIEITDISPKVVTIGSSQTFTITGKNLDRLPMTFNLDVVLKGCINSVNGSKTVELVGNSTSKSFTCTPTSAGKLTFALANITASIIVETLIACDLPQKLIGGVCVTPVSKITGVTFNNVVIKGEPTSFAIAGENLTDDMVIDFKGCSNFGALHGTATAKVFVCTPITAGNLTLKIGNSFSTVVKVTEKTPTCVAPQILQNGVCANPPTSDKYTKIDSNGNALDASATSWDCVKDNTTGLMWEVKTNDGGLRDQKWGYTWYDSNDAYKGTSSGTDICKTKGRCDTEKYTQDVNAQTLCGKKDWRIPNRDESMTLVFCTVGGILFRCFDESKSSYFPNTKTSWFWSSLTFVSNMGYVAWAFSIDGSSGWDSVSNHNRVRLVRSVR
jgi:pimeloyl-ACP methyl ester carboxylesterase